MRIHSDKITFEQLHIAVLRNEGLYPEISLHGSRKRDHAFELGIAAEPGEDLHEIDRCYSRNTGHFGAQQGYGRAATYIEWGDIIAELFRLDENAIVGPYDGARDFYEQTMSRAPSRPKRENAANHAARWARELGFDLRAVA